MKYSELEEKFLEIKMKQAELQHEFQIYKNIYSLPKTILIDDYTFQARWRVSPEEGLSYSIQVHRGKALVVECVQGELFRDSSVPQEVFSKAHEVKKLLEDWLTNKIDWPFNQEDYPRVT